MGFCRRVARAFRGERLNREIDEEFAAHIEEAIAHGRDPDEARRAFGSALRHRERSRDARLSVWLDSLRADAVFGWRQLKKNKVTSAAAVFSLALAMGACTSAFRMIDALLLRPLPVVQPERIHVVAFEGTGADGKQMTYDSCSYPMFERMRMAVKEQAELIAVSYEDAVDLTYGSDQEMEKEYLQYVSGRMFSTFGLHPAAGRLLSESDDLVPGAHPYAVISYDYWTRRFGQDRNAIGRTFRIGDTAFQIVGVAERAFTGTEMGTMTSIFVPMMMKNPRTLRDANNFWLRAFVQLKRGVAVAPVQEKLRAVFYALQEQRAEGLVGAPEQRLKQFFSEKLFLDPAAAGRSNLQRDYRTALTILGALVALVLLMACANVANLMTAQAAARAREMALRVSIGAGRWRLVQLVLVESAIRAFLAAIAGGLFAWWAAPFVVGKINPPDDPVRLVLAADWRTLGFALALTVAVTLLFGLAPALRAFGVRPASALKGGQDPHSRTRLIHALIAAQVAFCFLVLFAAGLFVATFDRLSHQPTGFSAERVLNLETVTRLPQPPEYWEQVVEHLRSAPGVESVAIAGWPLMSGESWVNVVSIQGGPADEVVSDFLSISPGWLDTMKIPFMDGRDFRPEDTYPPAAIVNQAFANQFFDGQDPVGKTFKTVDSVTGARVDIHILGFVRNARSRDSMRLAVRPTAYVPFRAITAAGALLSKNRGTFVVRTSIGTPLALASLLRQEVPRARPEFRVNRVREQVEINLARAARERLLAILALFFACVAVLLAGVGLYGVLHYSVLQRRKEIGIRMAVGAQAGAVVRLVTVEVFMMVFLGAGAGLALGAASARYMQALFFQVKASDLGLLAFPSLAILGVALLAALRPVLHAVRIDPASMLRTE